MAPRPRLLLGWQPLHSGCSLSSFPLPDPAPPLPPSPPHSRANLQSCGYQATLAQRRDWRTRKAAGGTDGADWCHVRGRVERGVTQMSDWRSKWEGAEAEMLRLADERIWSGFWVQKRDSGLVRRGSGGGDTNAKKWQGQDGQSWKRGSQVAGCDF